MTWHHTDVSVCENVQNVDVFKNYSAGAIFKARHGSLRSPMSVTPSQTETSAVGSGQEAAGDGPPGSHGNLCGRWSHLNPSDSLLYIFQ